jgi:hypothetical protein
VAVVLHTTATLRPSVHRQGGQLKSNDIFEPIDPLGPRKSKERLPLRVFVIAATSIAVGSFVWDRTNGDYLITMLVLALCAATLDIRLSN